METGTQLLVGFLGIALVGRLIADRMDRQRIRDNLSERGCETIEIHWNPFGPGWLGDKSDRIYEVIYTGKSGKRIVANCKTSMLSGVYWHDQAGIKQHSKDEADREPAACLSCGNPMGKKIKCPECGWSYKS